MIPKSRVYDILKLGLASFGSAPVIYPGLLKELQPEMPKQHYEGLQSVTLSEAVELSPLGTPVWFPVKFIGSTYRAYDAKGKLVDVQMDDFRLPVVSLGQFGRKKLMEVTNMGSGRGSVKEMDGHEDWEIEIAGIISDEPGHPQGVEAFKQHLQKLKQFDDLMSSIEVSSELLTELGIYRVAITDVSYSQAPGSPEEMGFSIKMLSDVDFELEELN